MAEAALECFQCRRCTTDPFGWQHIGCTPGASQRGAARRRKSHAR